MVEEIKKTNQQRVAVKRAHHVQVRMACVGVENIIPLGDRAGQILLHYTS